MPEVKGEKTYALFKSFPPLRQIFSIIEASETLKNIFIMIYSLEAEPGALLYPLLELSGLICQIISLPRRILALLLAGTILTVAGAAMDRDIALLVADLLAVAGLYVVIFHKK